MNRKKREGTRPSPGRPRSRAAETAILDAAYHLLAERGLKKATVEAIAAEAKVSKATIYKWWTGRAAVLMSAFLREARHALPYPTALNAAEIERCLMAMAHQFRGPIGQMMAAIIAEGQVSEDFSHEFCQGYINARRADGVQLVQQGIDLGILRPGNPHTILDLLYAPLYYRLLVKHQPITDAFVTEYVGLVLKGVLADDET
ncbi:TetR/AcrR family transcriptional regulator [Castellaniella sp.]|uniref:TetR/AcrR family transcriptional regulator n=1 Tax=Castellaniella sp. TaxID=1955812 RepID=UPI003569C355